MVIKKFKTLSRDAVTDIRKLEKVCQDYDGLTTNIFLDKSLNFNQDMYSVFLLYEGDELVSALSLFSPSGEEGEVSAYTLPSQRRKGHFKKLLREAGEELRGCKVQDVLFVCEAQSDSAKRAALGLRARYDFTEYLMRLGEEKLLPNSDSHRLKLQRPEAADLARVTDMSMEIFGDSYEDAKGMVEKSFQSETREQFLAFLDGKMIGMAAVSSEDDEVSVFGVGILPECRGMGYGREMMDLLIERLRQSGKKDITLEVNSKNAPAFELYQKCGFKIETAFDYYRSSMKEDLGQSVENVR